MVRVGPLLFVAAATAASTAPSGCGRLRGARVDVTRVETVRPEHAILRCLVDGGRAPIAYSWRLTPGIHQAGYGVPGDEAAMLVTVEPIKTTQAGLVTCTASDASGQSVSASVALGPMAITRAAAGPGTITVEGSGFGVRGADDAVWLVPARGAALMADSSCKQASWADAKIVACVPPPDGRVREVRVESGGRLALAPSGPVELERAAPTAKPIAPPAAKPVAPAAKPIAPAAKPIAPTAKPIAPPAAKPALKPPAVFARPPAAGAAPTPPPGAKP